MGEYIGKKYTFWQLLQQKSIEIPTVQRDYTYGSEDPKTERICDHLLDTIWDAFFGKKEENILNFVYGTRNERDAFVPLDGQQRLTTLFLIHLYAFWNLDSVDKTSIRAALNKFSYATRTSTENFCRKMVGYERYDKAEKISEQIRNQAFFIPSFDDDPSVQSMLVVLDKIQEKFKEQEKNLWNILIQDDCKVYFYGLDFGKYGFSDDLYLKMNSRGKFLTRFEVFKSKLEFYVEKTLNYPDGKDALAEKIDVPWSDLIWKELNRDLAKVDSGFTNAFYNILSIRYYLNGNDGEIDIDFDKDIDSAIRDYIKTKEDVDFLISFLDVFVDIRKEYCGIDSFWNKFFVCCDHEVCKDERIRLWNGGQLNIFHKSLDGKLTLRDLLLLYAIYYGRLRRDEDGAVSKKIRHIRNLIENSSDEIRIANGVPVKLFADIRSVWDGLLLKTQQTGFNASQWKEEQNKENAPMEWCSLYGYENHELLRGHLSLFFLNMKNGPELNSSNIGDAQGLLKKFEYLFADGSSECFKETRSILVSFSDISQWTKNKNKYRYLGCSYLSWRTMLTLSGVRDNQNSIINAIAAIDETKPLAPQIMSDTKNWRYYLSKYYNYTCLSYSHKPYYGVFYLADFNRTLEVFALQSTQHSTDNNIEWRLMNAILALSWNDLHFKNNPNESHINLGNRSNSKIRVQQKCCITICQEGWKIEEINSSGIIQKLSTQGFCITDGVCVVPQSCDYIEFGQKLLDEIVK